MLLKPYTVLNDEQRDPFALKHIGTVADNKDPEKRKRLRVQIDPWSYLADDELPWVKQEGDGAVGCSPSESSCHIPEIGSQVTVYFKNNDPNDPVYTGVETTEENRCTLFDENYPNSYGNKDSVGNYELVNKETKTTVRQYASGTTVRAEADGEMCIETKEGNYIKIDKDGIITLYGPKVRILPDDEVEIRATNINVVASNQLKLAANSISITSKSGTTISSGGNIDIGANANVAVKSKKTDVQNLAVPGAPDGDITEYQTGNVYSFKDGILRGIIGG